jgi:glutamyl-tRNA synthetase
MERVHKGGAKFDYEKAKWFNHEWVKAIPDDRCMLLVKPILETKGIVIHDDAYLLKVIHAVKDRCTLLNDFYTQSVYFFETPTLFDIDAIKPKWNDDKTAFFNELISQCANLSIWNAVELETIFKELAAVKNIKMGELQMPFRIMLVGGKFGPGVFEITEMIGKEKTIERVKMVLGML